MDTKRGTKPTNEQRIRVRIWFAETAAMFTILADAEDTHALGALYEILLDRMCGVIAHMSAEGIELWESLHKKALAEALEMLEKDEWESNGTPTG